MKTLNLFIVVAAVLMILAAFSCKKEEPIADFNSRFQTLYGDWRLVYTYSFIKSSDTTSFDILRIIKTKKYEIIEDGEIKSAGNIDILSQTESTLSIFFNSNAYIYLLPAEKMVFLTGNDSLYLRNSFTDGGESFFTRE